MILLTISPLRLVAVAPADSNWRNNCLTSLWSAFSRVIASVDMDSPRDVAATPVIPGTVSDLLHRVFRSDGRATGGPRLRAEHHRDDGRPPMASSMDKYVYDFAEGSKDMKDLLGGKGANLAEMTNLKLPVPPGFTITTEACRAYLKTNQEPAGLAEEAREYLDRSENATGKMLRLSQ